MTDCLVAEPDIKTKSWDFVSNSATRAPIQVLNYRTLSNFL